MPSIDILSRMNKLWEVRFSQNIEKIFNEYTAVFTFFFFSVASGIFDDSMNQMLATSLPKWTW